MLKLKKVVYRWCDPYGGGLVLARSIEDAKKKLEKALAEDRDIERLQIWLWNKDEYYDRENPDVFDIY